MSEQDTQWEPRKIWVQEKTSGGLDIEVGFMDDVESLYLCKSEKDLLIDQLEEEGVLD